MRNINTKNIAGNIATNPAFSMRKNGKSFYFASRVFTKEQMESVSLLYRLCRYIDDCADELAPEESRSKLHKIKWNLENPQSLNTLNSAGTESEQVIARLNAIGVDSSHIQVLLEGALFDVGGGNVKNRDELLLYCYRVAGVVGLMMLPILGVSSKEAAPHAIDLGIAMQLTNICRDILEDAQNGRCYLPVGERVKAGLTLKTLSKQGDSPESLKEIVKFYLQLADRYYASGRKGLSHIPLRGRFAILIASQVYREIGKKIEKKDYEVLQGRVSLSSSEKVWVSAKSLLLILHPYFWFS